MAKPEKLLENIERTDQKSTGQDTKIKIAPEAKLVDIGYEWNPETRTLNRLWRNPRTATLHSTPI